jgi:RNA polymerase sigma-70 factor (family 1)
MPSYTDHTEKELFYQLCQGNQKAFTEIYQRYWQVLFIHAHRMLRDEDEAMDVVQDCFEKLWTQSATLKITTSLRGYLYQAVRNQTLNAIDKSKRRDYYIGLLSAYLDEARPLTDETVLFRELVQRLEEEVQHLPPRMRRIFELSRYEGLSHKEIAAEMNISENTVKTVLGRAIKVVRGKLTSIVVLFI